jgi:hypothetical protein
VIGNVRFSEEFNQNLVHYSKGFPTCSPSQSSRALRQSVLMPISTSMEVYTESLVAVRYLRAFDVNQETLV